MLTIKSVLLFRIFVSMVLIQVLFCILSVRYLTVCFYHITFTIASYGETIQSNQSLIEREENFEGGHCVYITVGILLTLNL